MDMVTWSEVFRSEGLGPAQDLRNGCSPAYLRIYILTSPCTIQSKLKSEIHLVCLGFLIFESESTRQQRV